MNMGRQPSLFGRLMLAFLAVMLIIWLATLARTMYETRVTQKRIAQIENRGWAEQIMLNMRSLEAHPEAMSEVGVQIEQLRRRMFASMGFDVPHVYVQVWKGEQLVFGAEPGLPLARPAPAQSGSPLGEDWVSSVVTDSDLTVRRLAQVKGGWTFTTSGVAYYLTPLLYSFPFLLLPAWFLVRVGLRPLRAMVRDIEGRSSADLSPLAISPYAELAPLPRAINGLIGRLTQRHDAEKAFLADAAHELKTPLSVIQMNAHLLVSRLPPGADAARLHEASHGLQQGVARAAHTVHQLLALERVASDSSHRPLQEIDLVRCLRERLAAAATIAWQRGIELELLSSDSCSLPLDRESLEALIDNLLDNAIKYSPPHGRVLVSLSANTDGYRCTVQDQGPGIDPLLRARVFERFYRVPGQAQGGSGLGLAIAEQAAARNHASIGIEDGAGGAGVKFVVDFRRASARD
jgi:two-component system sensor histidine kinase QseC